MVGVDGKRQLGVLESACGGRRCIVALIDAVDGGGEGAIFANHDVHGKVQFRPSQRACWPSRRRSYGRCRRLAQWLRWRRSTFRGAERSASGCGVKLQSGFHHRTIPRSILSHAACGRGVSIPQLFTASSGANRHRLLCFSALLRGTPRSPAARPSDRTGRCSSHRRRCRDRVVVLMHMAFLFPLFQKQS